MIFSLSENVRLLKRLDFPDTKFCLYFMGYEDPASAPSDPVERAVWTFGQKATIELAPQYHNGNSKPRGFGHAGIAVYSVYKACEIFEHLGMEFAKKPDDWIAFIKDPYGY
uniref:VOC domain-containing protein n=1 Tax=Manihot esculenta TaxID=3983 RepID=A0A2C9V1L7_MANES